MTESQWEKCQDPLRMLDFVREEPTNFRHVFGGLGRWVGLAQRRPRCYASERKMRLFGCACCRLAWHLLPDVRLGNAIELTERHADGLLPDLDLAQWSATEELGESQPSDTPAQADARFAVEGLLTWIDCGPAKTMWAEDLVADMVAQASAAVGGRRGYRQTREKQTAILRDLCGPLIFRPVHLRPPGSGIPAAVQSMARQIYDEGTFNDLPILADALEDYGFSVPELLSHLRQDSFHVRGCWALDLSLEKG